MTALINRAIRVFQWENFITGPRYYLFFAVLMFIAAVGFIFVAMRYKEHTILHEEQPAS
jgi:hypothetical protein